MSRESGQGLDSAVVAERMELLDRVDEVRDELKGWLPAGSALIGIGA